MESNRSSSSINSYTFSSIASNTSINLIGIIYTLISISFNFDSILDIIDCYHSQRCQLTQPNLSEKSWKIYTTVKHFSRLPILTFVTILTCDSTYLFCSIRMHCILSRKSSGSNSSVKPFCKSITLIGSIFMVNTIFP